MKTETAVTMVTINKKTGNPTELCLLLRNREDKPHLFLTHGIFGCTLWCTAKYGHEEYFWNFAKKVMNHAFYDTPGEAARAWHDYKGN